MRYCGGEAGYLEALGIFEKSIDAKAAAIEQSMAGMDLDAYIIAVHSLKNTARTVGASAVSELAKVLEQAGNDRDIEKIQRDTPRLLEKYRSMKSPLEAALGTGRPEGAGGKALPPIPDEAFAEAMDSIRDLACAYDLDSVLMVLEMLAEYAIPESHRAVYEKLQAGAERCDWDMIQEALAESGL